MKKLLVGIGVALLLTAGCGAAYAAHPAPHVVTSREWMSVVNDWLDNDRVDHRHSCGAVVVAVVHLNAMSLPRNYTYAVPALARYAGTVCPRPGRPDRIAVGMTDGEVADIAGMPRTPRVDCWLYPVTRTHDGRRVCFTNGRVSSLRLAVHG